MVACFQTQHSALTEPSAGDRQALVCSSAATRVAAFLQTVARSRLASSCVRRERNNFPQLPLLSLYCCLSRFFLAALGLAALLHVLLFTCACLATPPSSLPSIGRLCWLLAFARSSSSLYLLACLALSDALLSSRMAWRCSMPLPVLGFAVSGRQRPQLGSLGLTFSRVFSM